MPIEMRNEIKASLIADLSGARNDRLMVYTVKLIDVLVMEARIENDRAGVRGVFRNQGKIEGLMQLKGYIERGFPSINKIS